MPGNDAIADHMLHPSGKCPTEGVLIKTDALPCTGEGCKQASSRKALEVDHHIVLPLADGQQYAPKVFLLVFLFDTGGVHKWVIWVFTLTPAIGIAFIILAAFIPMFARH